MKLTSVPLTSRWRQLIVRSLPPGSVLQAQCFSRTSLWLALAVFAVWSHVLAQHGDQEEEGQQKYSLKHLDLVCVRPATPADF